MNSRASRLGCCALACLCSYRYLKNKPFIKSRYCRGVPGTVT